MAVRLWALGETAVALELRLGRHGCGHPLFKERRDLWRKATVRGGLELLVAAAVQSGRFTAGGGRRN